MIFGERVRELRMAKGIGQRELADALGVTVQAISQLETDGGRRYDRIPILARALGVPISALFGEETTDPEAVPPDVPDDDEIPF